ncbi:hypothetical protein [Kingella sp. (in: b-proteobacteria)]|uniref:hypothetical protein n=1 Tax=Kingella sp. (in: b-proteobacteria) TaxID=2020713 RepID=UPI0026DD8414|nr:hypothetical protein [Kingella sp. (in: b-proteobacteria)]MDO4657172.1 hypothetical protein [Kingella sp. (in: b-proteobacteria)]
MSAGIVIGSLKVGFPVSGCLWCVWIDWLAICATQAAICFQAAFCAHSKAV